VILACNTASAKALRSIQQQVLPKKYPHHRVLGVIRPTAEVIQNYTQTNQVGVLGTRGTINSQSYQLEINKLFPDIQVFQESCPMWVPLIENNEHLSDGADYFVRAYVDALLEKSEDIDCILLACTHYPLLIPKIRKVVPEHIELVVQGDIVAESLSRYLLNHPEMETRLSRGGRRLFFTSGDTGAFDQNGSLFFGQPIRSEKMTPDCKSA
jgi:glutamate racemase